MGPFPLSFVYQYIVVDDEYVSKWVEAIPTRNNDYNTLIVFLKHNILAMFSTSKAIISDQRKAAHKCFKDFKKRTKKFHDQKILKKFGAQT